MMMKRHKNTTLKRVLPSSTKLQRLLLSTSFTLVLVAGCSSSDDDDEPPVVHGFVSVDVDEEDGAVETNLEAGFIRFNGTAISDIYFAAVAKVLDGDDNDICFVGNNAEVLELEFDPEIGETISAGETLTFSSSVGTYATLERQTLTIDGSTVLFYQLPGGALAGAPPSGLTLDIEGDLFPMFSDVAVPDLPASLNDFSPTMGEPADATTVFSWTPSGVGGASISLGLTSATDTIDCLVVDDGSFSLSDLAPTSSGLSETFNGTVRDVDRGAVTLERTDDAVLLITAEDARGE